MSQTDLLTALDLLKAGGFRLGAGWEKAHLICQRNAGSPAYDWVHALVHRIEGDDANAGYWYRRAGKTRHTGSVEEEWLIIRATRSTGSR